LVIFGNKEDNMKRLKMVITTLALVFGVVAAVPVAYAAPCGTPGATAKDCVSQGTQKANTGGPDIPTFISNVVRVMLFIIGAVSTIMIIYGGIKYSTSAGDSNKVTSAKNTIMYAVVGLVVSILAYTIVSFILDNIK
jgi:glucose uptake protein GlcU